MERPAGPRPRPAGRLTDAGSCAAPGCQGPASSAQRAPCAPPRAPPDLSAPSTTQDPAFQGQRARPWASLGWGPWPDGEDRAGVLLQPAGQTLGRFLSPASLLWILSRAPTACSPSRNLPRLFSVEFPQCPFLSPIWNHPGKGKLDGLGREPL